MNQVLRVDTGEIDGNEDGREWPVHYVLFQTEDDDGHECFDVYTDDGAGNGELVARGYNHERMRTLTLALGEFVEWAPGVGRSPTQEAR